MSLAAALELRRRCDYRGALDALRDATTSEELAERSRLHEEFGAYEAARRDAEESGDRIRLAGVCVAERRPREALELTEGAPCVERAEALEDLGRLDEADELYRALPDDDARVRMGRGSVLRARGEYAAAERELREALSLAERRFGERSIEAATALNGLGMTYKYWGRFEDGRRVYDRALEILIGGFGAEHPDVASLHHNLGGLEHARRDFAAAEPHARAALELRTRLLGAEHVATAEDEAALAPILHALGRDDEARALLAHALGVLRRELGHGHPEVAAALSNLASATPDLEEAASLYRQAVDAKELSLGPEHPSVAITLNNLAVNARRRGALDEAEALYRRALSILEAHVADDHPALVSTRRNLDRLLEDGKKPRGAAV